MARKKKSRQATFYPVTPGGTVVGHLASSSEDEAWEKLMIDAAHMPYEGRAGFEARGYTVERYTPKSN